MRKYFILFLSFVILINSFVFTIVKSNVAYAEAVVATALSAKLLVTILSGLGIYFACENDVFNFKDIYQKSHIDDVVKLEKIMLNSILQHTKCNVSSVYSNLKSYVNTLNFVDKEYSDVVLSPGEVKNVIRIDWSDEIKGLSCGNVYSVGDCLIKTVPGTMGGTDVYVRSDTEDGCDDYYSYVAAIPSKDFSLIKDPDSDYPYANYYFRYYDEILGKYITQESSSISICVDGEQVTKTYEGGSICANMYRDFDKDLQSTDIGYIFANELGLQFESLDEFLAYVQNNASIDEDFLDRVASADIYTNCDVLTPDLVIQSIGITDLPTIGEIPGAAERVIADDIPIDIDIDLPVPVDECPAIEYEEALNEEEDTDVLGLGLIIKLLKFIGNFLINALIQPINWIKAGVLSIYEAVKNIPNVIDGFKDKYLEQSQKSIDGQTETNTTLKGIEEGVIAVPGQLGGIEEGVRTIPGILQGIEEGVTTIPGEIGGIKEQVGTIPGLLGGLKEGILSIPTKLDELKNGITEKLDKVFEVPEDVSIDFTPFENIGEGLKTTFPFSIPFDFYNAVKSFAVQVEKPQFTIDLDTEYFNIHHTIDISFLNYVVGFFRYTALIWMTIVLITKTRDFIKW